MCLNFCMLYYFENAELTECKTFGYSHYKPRTGREKTIIMHKKKLRYFPITYRLQTLFMSPKTVEHMTWHQSHDAVDEVKCGNIFTMCILTFQLNQGMCILDYIETDSIHLDHLLLLILVSRLYLWFTTWHQEYVWGWNSCFYLRSYPILIVRAGI